MQNPLTDTLIEDFKELAPHITPNDRKLAVKHFKSNKTQIGRYVNGIISAANVDEALDVYIFLKEEVASRQEKYNIAIQPHAEEE